jgi:hypothetical protein
VEFCTIRGARDDGIEVRLHAKAGPVTTHIARHNTFTDCTTGIQFIDYEGDSHRRFEIYQNLITNTRSTALDHTLDTSDRNVDGSPMVEQSMIFNNTIDGCKNGITMAPNLVILNNMFTNTTTMGIVKGKYLKVGNNASIDYCLFFKNVSDYDKGLNMGENIFTFDPQYVDTTSCRLSPGSRAIDAGTATYTWKGNAVLRSFDTRYSGKAPDLGATQPSVDGVTN